MDRTYDTKFWDGFLKQAHWATHAAELAGLGALAIPSIQRLRGKPMDENKSSKYELGGLATLAAPSIAHGIGKLIHK